MDEEQRIYTEQGVEEYVRYQLEHENEPFSPGPAFPFVKVRSRSCSCPRSAFEGIRKQHSHDRLSREKEPPLYRCNPTGAQAWLGNRAFVGKGSHPSSGMM